ncbi:MAG: hypothetical protein AAFO91_13640 [Bacteroidota bacterium]
MQPNKLQDGNCLWRLLFLPALKPLKVGNRKTFEVEDLFQLDNRFLYSQNNPKLQQYYKSRKDSRSLFRIVVGYLWKEIFRLTVFDLIANLILVAIPYLFKELIILLEASETPGQSKCRDTIFLVRAVVLFVMFC